MVTTLLRIWQNLQIFFAETPCKYLKYWVISLVIKTYMNWFHSSGHFKTVKLVYVQTFILCQNFRLGVRVRIFISLNFIAHNFYPSNNTIICYNHFIFWVGAISRPEWKPTLRRVSQLKRIDWWGFLPSLLCTSLYPSFLYLFPSYQFCWG